MREFGIFGVFKLLSTKKLIWGITDGLGYLPIPSPAYTKYLYIPNLTEGVEAKYLGTLF